MLAWHFLPSDGRLQYGDLRTLVKPGQTLRRDPAKLLMCNYGLHASVRPIDALRYAPGPIVCRVRLGGTIIEGDDKVVASRRTVLWMANAERELRLFACWSIRNTPLADGRMVWDLLTDKRSQTAVEVAERYADGLATDDELAAAGDAAWAAAWAAGDAAWAAAWAAGDAAGDAAGAAGAAAWAAGDAAGAAARDAAWDAVEAVAWAARAAARAAANRKMCAIIRRVIQLPKSAPEREKT